MRSSLDLSFKQPYRGQNLEVGRKRVLLVDYVRPPPARLSSRLRNDQRRIGRFRGIRRRVVESAQEVDECPAAWARVILIPLQTFHKNQQSKNIRVTGDGKARILMFPLAKFGDPLLDF